MKLNEIDLTQVILDEEDLVDDDILQVELDDHIVEIIIEEDMKIVVLANGEYVAVPSIFIEYVNKNGDYEVIDEKASGETKFID